MKQSIEPLMPTGQYNNIEDLCLELYSKSNSFASLLNPKMINAVGNMVRSMNCYYSNLIENHNTSPIDIERALNNDYSEDPEKRDLQLEAKSHIMVQGKIDRGEYDNFSSLSSVALEIHKNFYKDLPERLCWVENKATGQKVKVIGGKCRDGDVQVGKHIAPHHSDVVDLLNHFDSIYSSKSLSKVKKIASVAAVHHRFCWIHPFYDGNGRVVRLLSHYMLRKYDVGSSLWSVSRGLARSVEEYKKYMEMADYVRQGDRDGRGGLSEKYLVQFMEYFLETCIDQVDFMKSLLQPDNLLSNIENYTRQEIDKGNLMEGSFNILREAFYNNSVPRGKAPELTGYKERQARQVLKTLEAKGLIIPSSKNQRNDVEISITGDVVESWFPNLYQRQ